MILSAYSVLTHPVFYTLLQLLIVAPILLPLHILYSPSTVDVTSMIRAGISSLVESSGSKWLWVHSVLIWWVTACWISTVIWIIWGGAGYRRREVARLKMKVEQERLDRRAVSGLDGARSSGAIGEMGQLLGQSESGRDLHAQIVETGDYDGDEPVGVKQYRTLMILNIPPDSE
jgi:hypothetical protein